MRIECEVCNATYTIDDAQLSDQPIGAQCPYCGHVRLVRKEAPGPMGAPAPGPGIGSSLGSASLEQHFGDPTELAPRGAGGGRFGSEDMPGPQGGGGVSLGSGYEQMGDGYQPPDGGDEFGFPGEPDQGSNRFGTPDLPASGSQDFESAAFGEEQSACQVCGIPLTDEFDKVIGLCDEHQRDQRGGTGSVALSAESGDVPTWHVRLKDGRIIGPLRLDDLRARIRQGEFTREYNYSLDGLDYAPMTAYKEIAFLAESERPTSTARASTAQARGHGLARFVGPLLLVGTIGAVAFVGISKRDKIQQIVEGFLASPTLGGPARPNPFRRYLSEWRRAHPDVSGTAHEHIVTATARHLEDSWASYGRAQDAYERALLLDENEVSAIAGYVENLAIWRLPIASEEEVALAETALEYAVEIAPKKGPSRADIDRAWAAMALAKGDLNGCRTFADRALSRSPADGRARLVLAGCYLAGNVQLAVEAAEQAKADQEDLLRADRVLADAYARVGRYGAASRVLEARLKKDQANAAVQIAQGELLMELGRFSDAEKHFKKATTLPGDRQAAFLVLAHTNAERGDVSAAIAAYRRAAGFPGARGARGAQIYTGWARAELERRQSKRAAKLADLALKLVPREPAALLARGRAALMAGSSTTAAVYARRTLAARSGEPAALVLAGRAALVEGRLRDALRLFTEAMNNQPRDPRLKGLLASVYLRQNGAPQAFALMRKAAEIDPEELASRRAGGLLALSTRPVLEAIEAFRRAASTRQNASVANASMGLLYYHIGQRGQARAAIKRALRLDEGNVSALIYSAQLALDDRAWKRAARAARKILVVERGSALGHLMLGRAMGLHKKFDQAQEHYEAALRSGSGRLSAKRELAKLRVRRGEKAKALEELRQVYESDPGNLQIRQALAAAGF